MGRFQLAERLYVPCTIRPTGPPDESIDDEVIPKSKRDIVNRLILSETLEQAYHGETTDQL